MRSRNAGAVRLTEHVLFRELPFGGVLLDRRGLRVFRLSQPASAALRRALHGPRAGNPFEGLIASSDHDPELTRRVLGSLGAQGLIRQEDHDG
ncbi:MAG: actinodefensin-associated protein B [Pseudonocardiaceae bacterium]